MAENPVVCVVGLGYVGLPLAVLLASKYDVIGFDVDGERVRQLHAGFDRTREVSEAELRSASGLVLTNDSKDIDRANLYIVTAPTPLDAFKRPDFGPLVGASRTVGAVLARGDIVVYESTVYPGATEEVCVPVLEEASGLRFNEHFFVGYSPERINPGDKEHRLANIVKVVSGSTPAALDQIDKVYGSVIEAGTHRASSIMVAEAAKVIENTQRDVNIALVNELAQIFRRLGIDSGDVLAAAGTKWNFLRFEPGLVGGHCIGVDPYYLTHKAQQVGHHPEMILAGRRINDSMGVLVADELVLEMSRKRVGLTDASVLVLGLAFKENCPDIRNSRVIDVVERLQEYGLRVDIYDPHVDPKQAQVEFGISLTEAEAIGERNYDAAIVAVAHDECLALVPEIRDRVSVMYDVKRKVPRELVDLRL